MEKQTNLPTKYELGELFVSRIWMKYNPDMKYKREDCAYVDTIYDRGDGIPQYVLYKKSDPEYEATVAENFMSELYCPVTDAMLLP